MNDSKIPEIHIPPRYCHYADGPCEHAFLKEEHASDAFFVYSSRPSQIAATIEKARTILQDGANGKDWKSWRSLPITGHVVFCEICKGIRFASAVIADVTTLNFNLLFEIGFTIGLGIPVVPIRDTTYISNKREFDELGVLDTLECAPSTGEFPRQV